MTDQVRQHIGSLNKDYKNLAILLFCVQFIYFWRDEYISSGTLKPHEFTFKQVLLIGIWILGRIYSFTCVLYLIYLIVFILYLRFLSTERVSVLNIFTKFNIDIGLTFIKMIPVVLVAIIINACVTSTLLSLFLSRENKIVKGKGKNTDSLVKEYVFTSFLFIFISILITYTYYSPSC